MSEPLDEHLDALDEMLEAMAEDDTARKMRKQVQPLRGIRGVPNREVAAITRAAWEEFEPRLPRDSEALRALFSRAWEDGLVAMGLAAACLPDAPSSALDLADVWLDQVDDLGTADTLGWLLWGPALLATGQAAGEVLAARRGSEAPFVRRAAVMAALAFLPIPVEGPAAAALRQRLGETRIQWVADPQSTAIHAVCDAFLRDEHPAVRKALRRLLRTWGQSDPSAVVTWAEMVRGGLPKLLKDEVRRAQRRAEREADPGAPA